MDKFKKYNEFFCEQFCEEMKKLEEKPTYERLKMVKELAEVWADLQCIEAGEAMRKITKRKYGYDEDMGMEEWDEEDIYAIYDASRGGRGGRRSRDSRGRYTSNRGGYGGRTYNGYDPAEDDDMDDGMRIENRRGGSRSRRGGRSGGSRGGTYNEYMPYEYNPNEMYMLRQENGRPIMTPYNAHEKGMAPKKLTKEQIKEWMNELENEDGTTGEHWNEQQVEQIAQKLGIKFEKFSRDTFRACMNMLYSDYCATLEEHKVDKPEVYACLAKDFLEDEDFD